LKNVLPPAIPNSNHPKFCTLKFPLKIISKQQFSLQIEKQDSSESQSLSSSSFISALSSQEDITLVNLHMQVNRPIVDSPLLMASYLAHLAQVGIQAFD
jgi:hypothetical protein